MHIYLIETSHDFDYQVSLQDYGQVFQLDTGKSKVSEYEVLFSDPESKVLGIAPAIIEYQLPVSQLKRIQNLKGIATKSSWTGYIDEDYCRDNHIQVVNASGYNSQSVAEYAIWMLLSRVLAPILQKLLLSNP